MKRERIAPDDIARVRAASRSLVHRGPDGAGEYASEHVALAARRLSIIDREGGAQPLRNEDGTLALVANGEIYNHVELRRSLESSGHRFATRSDCETILHLYEEHGADCVTHLRGMFAFALWDEARRRLLVARDRMGEKPLYLCVREGELFFASELKAILAAGVVPFELDAEAVDLYFHYQYVPEPRTPIKGVRKLDAAHLIVVDVDSWRVEERCYWRMEDAPPLEGSAAQLIREQLEDVSEIVVRSDVPVGVSLSGGLDSSAVTALAARARSGALQAFSVGYEGHPESDEREDARALARHLGVAFHDVEVTTHDVVEFFPELNYWRDDPIADIAGHGYYAVMKLARTRGVPVVLQGQGGDELFWGYPLLRQAARESLEKDVSRRASTLAAPLPYLSLNSPESFSRTGLSAWARSLGGLRAGWRRFRSHRATPAERMVFYDLSPDFRAAVAGMQSIYDRRFADELSESLATDLFTLPQTWSRVDVTLTRLISETYLRENGIAQGDRLSMASSVEMRLPLVDHKLVETVVGLRQAQTDVHLPPKEWLKEAVRDLLPQFVLERPKRGFAPPVREWHDALFAAHGDSLRDGYLAQAGVLSAEGGALLSRGAFPPDATSPLSFKALVLEQWCRRMSEATQTPAAWPGELTQSEVALSR